MLRINDHKMDLSLDKVGFVRTGKIFCTTCAPQEKGLDVLYSGQARQHTCDTCGSVLVKQAQTVSV